MNTTTAEFFWTVLMTGLINPVAVNHGEQHALMLNSDIELPHVTSEKLNLYFSTRNSAYLVEAALEAARSFRLTSQNPDNHLILVAFLLNKRFISAKEASVLSQIDSSHYSSMSKNAVDIVRLAEVIAEEERMGFKAADSDDFLESNLLEFCRFKGISFV